MNDVPAIKKPLYGIYEPVNFNNTGCYIIAIQGDCGITGSFTYQLSKWDGDRFIPVFDGVKENFLERRV